MKKQRTCLYGLVVLFCAGCATADDMAARIETAGVRFEQQTRQTLEAANKKDWWGHYDFPRLSLRVFSKSAPDVEKYFRTHPDRLLSLKLDALLAVDALRDKTYDLKEAPKESQGLLVNANTHMALLKKEKSAKSSLTEKERSQLKFIREYELDRIYRAYLEQCQVSFREAATNALPQLRRILDNKVSDKNLKTTVCRDILRDENLKKNKGMVENEGTE